MSERVNTVETGRLRGRERDESRTEREGKQTKKKDIRNGKKRKKKEWHSK